jgi:hypothetical protein
MIKSRNMSWARHAARIEAERNANSIFLGKADGKRPQGRQTSRLGYNIKTDLREIGWDSRDWIDLV